MSIFVKIGQLECLEMKIPTCVWKSVLIPITEIQQETEPAFNSAQMDILPKIRLPQEIPLISEYVSKLAIMVGQIILQESVLQLQLGVQQDFSLMKQIILALCLQNVLDMLIH